MEEELTIFYNPISPYARAVLAFAIDAKIPYKT